MRFDRFFPTDWNLKNFIDEDRKAILGHTAMQRFGTPDELTGAILWLAQMHLVLLLGQKLL